MSESKNPPTSDTRTTHKAHCHCGAVRFTVTLAEPFPTSKVNKCTCSLCNANGYLLVYPARRDVVFSQGFETLKEYQFGKKGKTHKFCGVCGSSVLIDFHLAQRSNAGDKGEADPEKDILAINVRMFPDLDLDKMEYTYFDGKNLLQPPHSVE